MFLLIAGSRNTFRASEGIIIAIVYSDLKIIDNPPLHHATGIDLAYPLIIFFKSYLVYFHSCPCPVTLGTLSIQGLSKYVGIIL